MKHLITSLTILFISSNLFGQETGVLYLYKTSSGLVWKTIGDDKIQAKYNGAIKNGEPEGIGNLTSPDGDKFDGVWKDGKKHGQGTYSFSSGASYEGKWKDSKQQLIAFPRNIMFNINPQGLSRIVVVHELFV